MVARSAFLILCLLLPTLVLAEGNCGKCHPPHYAEAGSCTSCHRGDPRTERPDLAHHDLIEGRFAHFAIPGSPVTEQGRKLLDAAGCRRCHRSGAKGNRLASDLDRLLPGARPQEVLQSIREPVLFMPDFAFSEATAIPLVNALLAHSAQAPPALGEVPLVVHFEGTQRAENVFDKHCGGCHRVLTPRWGGVGNGRIGPNLSGLTSEFYPVHFREGEPWSAERLKKWLENPRAVRPQARMRPVRLTQEESRLLLEILGIETDGKGTEEGRESSPPAFGK